jgi:hypothetical protein
MRSSFRTPQRGNWKSALSRAVQGDCSFFRVSVICARTFELSIRFDIPEGNPEAISFNSREFFHMDYRKHFAEFDDVTDNVRYFSHFEEKQVWLVKQRV